MIKWWKSGRLLIRQTDTFDKEAVILSFLRFALSVLSPSDLVHEGLELTRMNTSRHAPIFTLERGIIIEDATDFFSG